MWCMVMYVVLQAIDEKRKHKKPCTMLMTQKPMKCDINLHTSSGFVIVLLYLLPFFCGLLTLKVYWLLINLLSLTAGTQVSLYKLLFRKERTQVLPVVHMELNIHCNLF